MNELTKVESFCELSSTGLKFKREVTEKEWQYIGGKLKFINGAVQFWIGDWANFGISKKYASSDTYDKIEEITGLDRGTIQNYKHVSDMVPSSLRNEDLSYNHHVEVAKLEPKQQDKMLEKALKEKMSVRELREEIRKDGIKTDNNIKIPKGKYSLIYADPPWKYGNSMPEYFTDQANHYPLMDLDEICKMPIQDIVDKNAVLFLWVTSPILEESFRVINSWGFEYRTSFVWDKIKHNMGHYNSVRHEFLLLCIKGVYPIQNKKLFDSVISSERTEHSKKPKEVYNIIETIYPESKKIELFAREKRAGWSVYGNQIQ